MAVWFTVLKVVLILFLAIILFVLLVAGIALLSPAKYKLCAEKYGVIKAKGNVSWLFGIIRVLILYDDGKHSYNIKIFGVDYKKFVQHKNENKIENKKKNKKEDKKEDKKKDKKENQNLDYDLGGKQHEEKDIGKDTGKKASERKEDKTACKEDKKSKEVKKDNKGSKQDTGKRNSKKTSSSGKIHKKAAEKEEEADSKRQKISKIKEFVFAENTKSIVGVAKNSLLHLLLKIKPRKIKSDILFGTGDACLTGWALGAISVYMAMTGTVFNITPDFENRVLRGRLEVSGHIRAVSFLLAVLKVVLNRQWKSFYREAKKIKEEL